jgi:hypothetical protein
MGMAIAIDPASRITDIVHKLEHPENYVSGVLENLWHCRGEHGVASVRIGITGEGKAPNYLVEYSEEGPGSPPIFGAFHGRSHKRLVEKDAVRDEHWSQDVLYFEDVQRLIGEIRSRPNRGRARGHRLLPPLG